MKKLVMVLFYVDGVADSRTYEYKIDCVINQDDDLVCIQIDGKSQMVIKTEHFIALEKVEE